MDMHTLTTLVGRHHMEPLKVSCIAYHGSRRHDGTVKFRQRPCPENPFLSETKVARLLACHPADHQIGTPLVSMHTPNAKITCVQPLAMVRTPDRSWPLLLSVQALLTAGLTTAGACQQTMISVCRNHGGHDQTQNLPAWPRQLQGNNLSAELARMAHGPRRGVLLKQMLWLARVPLAAQHILPLHT